MPLTPPAPREAFHHRLIECDGYRRADGLWDIEAHMTDRKTYPFPNAHRGEIAPGEPLHDMWLRLTLDEHLVVQKAEAATEAGPFRVCETEGRGRFGPADRPSARTLGIPYQHQGREECKIN